MEPSGDAKLSAALSTVRELDQYSDIKESISTTFKGMSVSISQGEASISFEPNAAEGSIKISMTANIPKLQVSENLSTTFSQTITMTIRSKFDRTSDTPDEAQEMNGEVLLSGFPKEEMESLGRGLAIIEKTLFNPKVLNAIGDSIIAGLATGYLLSMLRILLLVAAAA